MRISDWSSDVCSSDLLLTNSAYKMVAIDDQSVQQNDAFSQTSQQLQQTTTGYNTGTNNVLSAVPEPETWVQLVAGFGMVGWLMRRSRSGTRAAVGRSEARRVGKAGVGTGRSRRSPDP